jgi:two-component system phosphate regulon sensor histidine kinase PhoR
VRKQTQKQVYLAEVEDKSEARGESVERDQQDAHVPSARHAYLEASIESATDGMIFIDQSFHVLDLNPAACKALHCSSEEGVTLLCSELLRCKNLNRMELCGTSSCPLTRVLQKREPLPNEELIIGREEEHVAEVSASVTLVQSGIASGVAFSVRDLSALKVANSVRSNFVSMVSHELRTPLNSVHGFIDLLLLGHMGELQDEQRTYLGYAQEGVLQLVSMVEDILLMTRSDLGQFEIKASEFHLRGLVRQIISSLQPQALKAGVVLFQEIPENIPSLYADPQRIKQVLNNLVINAIKFTPPGGSVTVKAWRRDEQFEVVSVADTGYGIPPEDQPHIFERFYQSNHSQQSKMGGYGLGLSIARLIIEQHRGTIDFVTALNQGTTFEVCLPLYHGQDNERLDEA